jgi:WD40 repeat protein
LPAAAAALAADKPAAAGVLSVRVAALVERGTRTLVTGKLNLALLLFAVCLAAAGAALVACQPPADALQGGQLAQAPDPVAPPARRPQSAENKPMRPDGDGDPLPEEGLARLGTRRFRPGGFVWALAFTPDGKTLVAHGTTGNVCVLNTATGRAVRRFQTGGSSTRRGSALSSDGRWLVVNPPREGGRIDAEVVLELWDCSTGQKVRDFGQAPYTAGFFSPDGRTLAALRFDSTVEIWDPHAGRLLRSWKASEGPGYDLDFTARFTDGGKLLLTSHQSTRVRGWDVATGARLQEFSNVLTSTLFAASPQGVLAVDGTDYKAKRNTAGEFTEAQIRLFDVVHGKELRPLVVRQKKNPLGQPWWIRSGDFSPDGKLLATGGHDGIVRLWDVGTGKEVRSWPYLPYFPGAFCFSPDGQRLAVCDAGTTVRLFDVASGAEAASPPGNRSGFFQSAITPDGKTVLTLGVIDRTLHAWDSATGQLRRRHEWLGEQMAASSLTHDGATIFSWANDQTVRTWDVRRGKEVNRWQANYGPYFSGIVPSPDGKTLALLYQNPVVVLVDAATGKEWRRLEAHAPWPFGAAFRPDGRSLVTWGADARARVWDLATGRELRQFAYTEVPDRPGPIPIPPGGAAPALGVTIYSAAVSPDFRLLAFGSRNRFIEIHDLHSGHVVRRVDHLPDGVSGMAFSPDRRTLAWYGPDDPTMRLLEVASGRERHQLTGHLGRVTSLTFSADGRRLISGSADTTALVWDLAAVPADGTAVDREAAWADLAGEDAVRAYRAVRRLAASPAFLRDRLQPVPVTDETRVARLIADLDRDNFAARETAAAELERLGDTAAAACRKALEDRPSAEVRRRLEALVNKQARAAWDMTPERLRTWRALEAMELSGTLEARQLLQKVAGGMAGAHQTEEAKAALGRLDSRAGGP